MDPETRDSYTPTGIVSPAFVAVSIPLAIVAALLMGAIFFGFMYVGCYFVLYLPLFGSFAGAWLVLLGISSGKCRNRVIAAVYGIGLGVLVYASYYYFDMVYAHGVGAASRIDMLPTHIWMRWQTDQIGRPGFNRDIRRDPPPVPWINTGVFLLELGFLAGLPGFTAVRRAASVYCEKSRQWADLRIVPLGPGTGQDVVDALLRNRGAPSRLEEDLAGVPLILYVAGQPYCELVLEICPEPCDTEGCSAYISVREIAHATKWKMVSHYLGWTNFLIRQRRLDPEEFRCLRQRFLAGIWRNLRERT